jgi:hypothetical protein
MAEVEPISHSIAVSLLRCESIIYEDNDERNSVWNLKYFSFSSFLKTFNMEEIEFLVSSYIRKNEISVSLQCRTSTNLNKEDDWKASKYSRPVKSTRYKHNLNLFVVE